MKTSISLFILLIFFGLTFGAEKATVAIFDLEAGGCSEMEAKSITNRIRTELFLTEQFTVLERQMMEEVLNEQGFQMSGCTSSECVVQAGRILGVERMVGGSLDRLGNLYTVNLRVINVENSKILAVSSVDCMTSIEDVATKSTKEAVSKLLSQLLKAEPIENDEYQKQSGNYFETEGDNKFRTAVKLLSEDNKKALNLLVEIITEYADCQSADDALYELIINDNFNPVIARRRIIYFESYYPDSEYLQKAKEFVVRER